MRNYLFGLRTCVNIEGAREINILRRTNNILINLTGASKTHVSK